MAQVQRLSVRAALVLTGLVLLTANLMRLNRLFGTISSRLLWTALVGFFLLQGLSMTACVASTNVDGLLITETQTQDTVFGNYSSLFTSSYLNRLRPSVQIAVYDPDGIDTVWFFYKRTNESVGQNQTMRPMESEPRNRYSGYFDAYVTDLYTDWTIRFYANDSNGIESASEEYSLRVAFNPADTLPTDGADYALYTAIIAIPILVILIAVVIKKRSGKQET